MEKEFNREQALKKKAEINYMLKNNCNKCNACDVVYQGEHSCNAEKESLK